MKPTLEMIEDIERRRLQRAREMSGEFKMRAGSQLFETACRIMRDGIRYQFPDADEAEVERQLLRRLEFGKLIEESM